MIMNTIEHIIQSKAFDQLTSDELEAINELVANEEEFLQMKAFLGNIGSIAVTEQFEAPSSVKKSLDQVFKAKHPGLMNEWQAPAKVTTAIIPLYQRNWFRIAAIVVLLASTLPFFFILTNSKQVIPQVAQNNPVKSKTSDSNQHNPVKNIAPNEVDPALKKETTILLAKLSENEEMLPVTISSEFDEAASPESVNTYESVSISFKERGKSADLFFNSSKDLASKSFAQPVNPDDLLTLISPAF